MNVVGQCFYDGGLYIHVLYGVLCAGFMRFYDELLVRQAGNPVLIGGLVFLAPQIIGFPRGSIDALGLQVILGFFSVLLTCFMSRIVFGTGITYPRTDHLVDYPNLRSPKDWARWMSGYTALAYAAQERAMAQYDDDQELD